MSAEGTKVDPQAIVQQFGRMRSELQSLASKITDLEMDKEEHTWVESDRSGFPRGPGLVRQRNHLALSNDGDVLN
jgi:hypothetical protein